MACLRPEARISRDHMAQWPPVVRQLDGAKIEQTPRKAVDHLVLAIQLSGASDYLRGGNASRGLLCGHGKAAVRRMPT